MSRNSHQERKKKKKRERKKLPSLVQSQQIQYKKIGAAQKFVIFGKYITLEFKNRDLPVEICLNKWH